MQFSKLTWQLLSILFACLVAYFYLQNEDEIKHTATPTPSKTKPTAFFEGSEITFYDKAGRAEFILSSQTGLFFKEQDEAIIENPTIKLLNQNETSEQTRYSSIKANKALYKTDDELLSLKGDVHIQLTSDNSPPLEVSTDNILIDKNARFISTEQAVTMQFGTHQLTSVGLHAWIDDKKIKLLSKVRGRYELSDN